MIRSFIFCEFSVKNIRWQWRNQYKFFGGAKCLLLGEQQYFCLGRHFSKHNMTTFAKNSRSVAPWSPTWPRLCQVDIGLGSGDFWMPLFGHKNKSKIVELGRYWMPFCSDAGMTTFNSQIVELVIVGCMQQTCIAKAGIILQTK